MYLFLVQASLRRLPYPQHWDEFNVTMEAVHSLTSKEWKPRFFWYPPLVANLTAQVFWVGSLILDTTAPLADNAHLPAEWASYYPIPQLVAAAQLLFTLSFVLIIAGVILLAQPYCSHWAWSLLVIPLLLGFAPFVDLGINYLNVDIWGTLMVVALFLWLRKARAHPDSVRLRGAVPGILVGMALCCKYPYGIAGLVALLDLFLVRPRCRTVKILVAFFLAVFLSALVVGPQLFLFPLKYTDRLIDNFHIYGSEASRFPLLPLFESVWACFGWGLLFVPFGIYPIMKKNKVESILLGTTVMIILAVFVGRAVFYERNLLFVYFVLAILLCVGLDRICRSLPWNLSAPAAMLAVALTAVRLGEIPDKTDSRTPLFAAIESLSSPNTRILVPEELRLDAIGTLPPSVTSFPYRNSERLAAEQRTPFTHYVRFPVIDHQKIDQKLASGISSPLSQPCQIVLRTGRYPLSLVTLLRYRPRRPFPMGEPYIELCRIVPPTVAAEAVGSAE